MRVPPSIQLDPAAPDLLDRIDSLPVSAGIYALGAPGQAPHLSWSSNVRTRLRRLLTGRAAQLPTESPNLLSRLRASLGSVQCWPTASRLETALLMHALAKQYFPTEYLAKLRLRMPWFLTLSSESGFPRLVLSNRIARAVSKTAAFYGPFLTRDLAQDYEQKVLGLFQLRRCVESFVPSPEHPGCIYGEMGQCLRPCQAAVTPDEYATEAARVAEFLLTNGSRLGNSLLMARDRAAEATDFEQAAYLHKRLERVKEASGARDPVIGEVGQLSGVALTRGFHAGEIRLWILFEGYWQEPVTLTFAALHDRPVSLDKEVRDKLRDALLEPLREGSLSDDLAIFSRWYYSSWRDGHWFPFRTLADLNYRKMVREISNVVKETTDSHATAKPC